MDIAFKIMLGAGLFLLWPAAYIMDQAQMNRKVCFIYGPFAIFYLLSFTVLLILRIVFFGFDSINGGMWFAIAIEILFFTLAACSVLIGARDFLTRPKANEQTKETKETKETMETEASEEIKEDPRHPLVENVFEETNKEEPNVSHQTDTNEEPGEDTEPYIFEFLPCETKGQFLIKLKFTENIPSDEDPTIYYRRMIDIITATLLKDAILNIYEVRLEYREDYDPKYPKNFPFYIFKLYDAGEEKLEGIKDRLLKKDFIKNQFFHVVPSSKASLPSEILLNDFHESSSVFYGNDAFEVDGFCFRDDSSKDGPGFNLKEPSQKLIEHLNFCFRSYFKYVCRDSKNKGERYSYLFLFFYRRDILLADCAALLMMNISLNEYKSVYQVSLNYPHKKIRQATHPYKVYDFTEIPVCIPYAASSKEREVVRQEKWIRNGVCFSIEDRLKKEYEISLMHIYVYHEFHNGFWFPYYNVYVPPISDELAKEIQNDLESYQFYRECAKNTKYFSNSLLLNLCTCKLLFLRILAITPPRYFMIVPFKDNMMGVDLIPKKNKKDKKKAFLIRSELETNSNPWLIKLKKRRPRWTL